MTDLSSFQTYLSINVSQKTMINYVNQMTGFFRCHSDFTQEEVNKYLSSKVSKWNGGSTNQFYKAVKWYMKFTKIIVELPKYKDVENKPRPYLIVEDIDEILKKIQLIFNDYQKAELILELLFKTGMRPSEILNLKREHINLDELKILLVDTKTDTSRTVFITKDLASKISLFINRELEVANAFNLNQNTLGYYAKRISEMLNINFYPYMGRHTFAHDFLKKSGNDLRALSKILGHTDLNTTMLYSDIDEKELQDIYNKAFKKRKGKK